MILHKKELHSETIETKCLTYIGNDHQFFQKANTQPKLIEKILNFYNNHFVVNTFLRNDDMLPN
jgi:hypothetical protein